MRQSTSLLGLHRPGHTLLHRAPAGAKLLGLLVCGVVAVAVTGPVLGPVGAVLFVAAGLGLMTWAGAGVRTTLAALRGILVVAVLLGAWQTWQNGWAHAVEVSGDLVALVLAASVLTLTTPIDEMLDTLTRALRPLRVLRVDPEAVALAFSLMIRAVPTTLALAEETRDAALARGLERSPRARLTPLVIRVVRHAQATGEALTARGILEAPDPPPEST